MSLVSGKDVGTAVTILTVMEEGQAAVEKATREKDERMLQLVEALKESVQRLTDENTTVKLQLAVSQESAVVHRAEVVALNALVNTTKAELARKDALIQAEIAVLKEQRDKVNIDLNWSKISLERKEKLNVGIRKIIEAYKAGLQTWPTIKGFACMYPSPSPGCTAFITCVEQVSGELDVLANQHKVAQKAEVDLIRAIQPKSAGEAEMSALKTQIHVLLSAKVETERKIKHLEAERALITKIIDNFKENRTPAYLYAQYGPMSTLLSACEEASVVLEKDKRCFIQ